MQYTIGELLGTALPWNKEIPSLILHAACVWTLKLCTEKRAPVIGCIHNMSTRTNFQPNFVFVCELSTSLACNNLTISNQEAVCIAQPSVIVGLLLLLLLQLLLLLLLLLLSLSLSLSHYHHNHHHCIPATAVTITVSAIATTTTTVTTGSASRTWRFLNG